jgi:caa(3)-type oxidase subunit IV
METAEGTARPSGKGKQPNYYFIWFVLFALTVVEVGVAFLSGLPRSVLILVLVGLAVWKAALVAMYYMHLRFERLRLVMLAVTPLPLAAILVLAVLLEYAR